MATQTVTVLAARGKTGRRVAEALRAGGHRVRAASRSSEFTFDWGDESTWPGVIAGADAVYLVADESANGNDRLAAFVDLADREQVRRLVLLSARQWSQFGFPEHTAREDIVRASRARWTILRPVWFDQNFSEGSSLARGVVAGTVVHHFGDGRHPFVDAVDIGAVAAASLTDDRHAEQHYELTGPGALTVAEAVGLIENETGRPLEVRDAGADDESGVLTRLHDLIRTGQDAYLSDGVQRALGREPRDFATFVRETSWPSS